MTSGKAMDIVPIYKRVIGLDVHQAKITGRAITEQPEGSVTYERREFGGFTVQARPQGAGSGGHRAWVVNARHVKAVPDRKTDVADAQWLASLARAGLLRASFIAKADLRSLRHIARHRQKRRHGRGLRCALTTAANLARH